MSTSHTYLYNPTAVLDQVVALDTIDQQTLTSTSEVTDHPIEASAPKPGSIPGGDSITDHQINHPLKFSISGFISNTPIDDLSFARKGDGVPVSLAARGFLQTVNVVVPSYEPVSGATARRNPITGQVDMSNVSVQQGQRTIAFQSLVFGDEVNPVKDALVVLELWKSTKLLITYVDPMFIWRNMSVESYSCTLEGKVASTGQPGGAAFTIDLKQVTITKSASVDAPTPKEPRGQHEQSKGKATPKATGSFDVYQNEGMGHAQVSVASGTGNYAAEDGWFLVSSGGL